MESEMLFMPIMINSNRKFPRYGILDNRKKYRHLHRYWRGKESKKWTSNFNKAMIWEDYQSVIKEIREIYRTEYGCLEKKNFVIEIEAEVFAASGLTIDQFADWIMRSMKINLDYHNMGMGPKESIVFVRWVKENIKEINSSEQSS